MIINKNSYNSGKNLICFVLTLFMAMPAFSSSQDEDDIKGPSRFSTVRTDSSQTQRRFRSDSEGDISDSEASSDGGRSMHETKDSRAHRGLSDDALFGRRPSDDSVSSSSHGEDVSYSQSSEAQFINFTFGNFLLNSNNFLRYQNHSTTSVEATWRKGLRYEFLNEVVEFIKKGYHNNEHDIQEKLAEIGNNKNAMKNILLDIHRHAINAYGEDLFGGNRLLSNIGTYRHTFCKVYIETLQGLAPTSSIVQLELESSYLNRDLVEYSTIGSVRPDVYWPSRGIVFDFKNFSGSVTNGEDLAWNTHLPVYNDHESIEEES